MSVGQECSDPFHVLAANGFAETFDGPGRAIRCALDFETAAMQIGLPLRAGLHTGEVEIRDKDIGSIAVHAAARVMALSSPGEVLVSRVVTDLVAGAAGLKFSERGSHELKGLPGRWDLFAASGLMGVGAWSVVGQTRSSGCFRSKSA